MISKLNFSQPSNIEHPLVAFANKLQSTGDAFLKREMLAKAQQQADEDRAYQLDQRKIAANDRAKKLAGEAAQRKFAQVITDPRQNAAGSVTDAFVQSKNNGGKNFSWELTPEENKELEAARDADGFMKKDAKLSPTILAKLEAQSKSQFGLDAGNAGSILNNDKFKETRLEQLLRAKNEAEKDGGVLPLSVYDSINKQQAADVAARAKEMASANKAVSDALDAEEDLLLKKVKNGGLGVSASDVKSIRSNVVKSQKVANDFIEDMNVPKDAQGKIINSVTNLLKDRYSSEQIRAILTKAYKPGESGWLSDDKATLPKEQLAGAKATVGEPVFKSTKSAGTDEIYDRLLKARNAEYKKAKKSLEVAKMTPQEKRAQYILGLRGEDTQPVVSTSSNGDKSSDKTTKDLNKSTKVETELDGVPNYMVAIEGGAYNKAYPDGKVKTSDGKLVAGKAVSNGYNYTTKSPKEIREDFEAAGISNKTILDAIAGKDITLTDKENKALARHSYEKYGVKKAKSIVKGFDDLPPMIQEMATQMAYRGDLAPGQDSYKGDLVKLLETGDMNKVYEYVNTSDRIKDKDRKILKARLNKTLTTLPKEREEHTESDDGIEVEDKKDSKAKSSRDLTKAYEFAKAERARTNGGFFDDMITKARLKGSYNATPEEIESIMSRLDSEKRQKNLVDHRNSLISKRLNDTKLSDTIKGYTNSIKDYIGGVGIDQNELAEQNRRALDIVTKAKVGENLTNSQKRWLESVQKTPEGRERLRKMGYGLSDTISKKQGPITEEEYFSTVNQIREAKDLREAERTYMLELLKKDPAAIYGDNPNIPESTKDKFRAIQAYLRQQRK